MLGPLSCPVRGARGIEEQTQASEAAHCCSPQATVRSACDADKLHYSVTSSSTMLLALVAEGIQWSHPTGRRAAIVTSIISLALNTSFSAHDCKYYTDNRPGSSTHHHLHRRSLQVMLGFREIGLTVPITQYHPSTLVAIALLACKVGCAPSCGTQLLPHL